MSDREKVIKGLEQFIADFKPFCGNKSDWQRVEDALALLRTQEPQMVEERADTDTINCPKCGQQFARVGRDKSIYLDTDEEPNYCPKCGQKLDWEGIK